MIKWWIKKPKLGGVTSSAIAPYGSGEIISIRNFIRLLYVVHAVIIVTVLGSIYFPYNAQLQVTCPKSQKSEIVFWIKERKWGGRRVM